MELPQRDAVYLDKVGLDPLGCLLIALDCSNYLALKDLRASTSLKRLKCSKNVKHLKCLGSKNPMTPKSLKILDARIERDLRNA